MPTKLDGVFSGHEHALAVNRQRLELLASNLAHAETPGYKARDLDFQSAMQAAGNRPVTLAATRQGHITATDHLRPAAAMYRVPDQPSADGNTVDANREKTAFAEASARYQATLTFLNQRIRGLKLAITGSR